MTATTLKTTPTVPNPKRRFVQQLTWYISKDGRRTFVVVDKTGRFNDAGLYATTQVTLLELLSHSPIYLAIDEFWAMIDEGKLVEYVADRKSPGIEE